MFLYGSDTKQTVSLPALGPPPHTDPEIVVNELPNAYDPTGESALWLPPPVTPPYQMGFTCDYTSSPLSMPSAISTTISPLPLTAHDNKPLSLEPDIFPDSTTPGRKFACLFKGCERRFNRADNLKAHTKTHSAQRRFQCDSAGCAKSYTRKADLTRHERITHNAKGHCYYCWKCFKGFSRKDSGKR